MFVKKWIVLILTVCPLNSAAEIYINTSDLALKASLHNLSATGQLNTPISTYPLLWGDIKTALNKIDVEQLPTSAKNAYFHVQAEYSKSQSQNITISANGAKNKLRFTSFGDSFRNKNNITLSMSGQNANFAYKIVPSITSHEFDGDQVQWNDSYLAAKVGNWYVSFGTQDRWWGPGWDTNMGLSNNARPIPAFALTRNKSTPFSLPFIDHKIPWTMTTFMGEMEHDRYIPNTLLWGFRLSVIPFENLEVSLVRLSQWGGEGRKAGISTFINVLLGRDNCNTPGSNNIDCGENHENEPGNQSAGIDARYTISVFDQPISIYGQYLGEDGNADGGLKFITKPMNQLGIDTSFVAFDNTINTFLEYSFTFQQCGTNDLIANCIYEHHIYKTGMRYKKRSIGSSYDNDATSYVLGFIGQNHLGVDWDLRLRYVKLNQDNSDRFPGMENGNTVSEIAENLKMISANVKKSYGHFSYKIGFSYGRSSYIDLPSNSESNIYLEFERVL